MHWFQNCSLTGIAFFFLKKFFFFTYHHTLFPLMYCILCAYQISNILNHHWIGDFWVFANRGSVICHRYLTLHLDGGKMSVANAYHVLMTLVSLSFQPLYNNIRYYACWPLYHSLSLSGFLIKLLLFLQLDLEKFLFPSVPS